MVRIYEVRTETKSIASYEIYNIAAKNFSEAVTKAQARIEKYKHLNNEECISEVKIIAREN
jgi:hypothetical protein